MGQDLSSPAASSACESANVSADLYISAACNHDDDDDDGIDKMTAN